MKKRTCLDCEFYDWHHQDIYDEMRCMKKRWIIYGQPEDGIPGWCPVRLAERRAKKERRKNENIA